MIQITDFHDPALDLYARTPEVQLLRYREPKPGVFIAESPKVIARALDGGYEPVSFLMEPKHVETQGSPGQHGNHLPDSMDDDGCGGLGGQGHGEVA